MLSNRIWSVLAATTVCLTASAQDSGYRISENYQPDQATADAGPVRMARISYLKGGVSWRPGEDVGWTDASANLPLRQGAEIFVGKGSRAEIQFDDGSCLRLAGGSAVTLQTLYSDSKGEFTEVKLNDGLGTLRLTSALSLYQVDTPLASVKAAGPARLRIGATNGFELADKLGNSVIEGAEGPVNLKAGEYLYLNSANDPYVVRTAPSADPWDKFNDDRDYWVEHRDPNLPPSMQIVASDMDSYGRWHDDPEYGHIWVPAVSDPAWRPYHAGRWVWVSPFGWTWVSDEPWGWAPYHYGTWVHQPYGWGWVPGPAQQYWSPAVVQFSYTSGAVAWCPLAPREVRYPAAISIGFASGNWALSFSIGGAACYYPVGPSYCAPRPWTNVIVNRQVNIYNVTRVTNFYGPNFGRGLNTPNGRFVSVNARMAAGASSVPSGSFASGGRAFVALPRGQASIFEHGNGFAAPARGDRGFAGPQIAPGASSFASRPGTSHVQPSVAAFQRSVYRAKLPQAIARRSAPIGHVLTPSARRPAGNQVSGGNLRGSVGSGRPGSARGSFGNRVPNRAGAPRPGGDSSLRDGGRITGRPVSDSSSARISRTSNHRTSGGSHRPQSNSASSTPPDRTRRSGRPNSSGESAQKRPVQGDQSAGRRTRPGSNGDTRSRSPHASPQGGAKSKDKKRGG